MFLLTATPVNNRLTDLQHMMELFSRRQADYFRDAPLGIYTLRRNRPTSTRIGEPTYRLPLPRN
jgi:hypothetical protein